MEMPPLQIQVLAVGVQALLMVIQPQGLLAVQVALVSSSFVTHKLTQPLR
jgi:hypothetical protein